MNLRNLEEDARAGATDHHIIESQLLNGERFVLALDKSALKKLRSLYPGLAIYFLIELEELLKFKDDVDHIKAVHKLKKAFRGWIVPSINK